MMMKIITMEQAVLPTNSNQDYDYDDAVHDDDYDDEDNHHGAGNAIVRRSQTAIESKTMFVGLLMLRMMIMRIMIILRMRMIIMMLRMMIIMIMIILRMMRMILMMMRSERRRIIVIVTATYISGEAEGGLVKVCWDH